MSKCDSLRCLALPILLAAALSSGCSSLKEQETKMAGRAVLQGQSQHGGSLVVLDGFRSTTTAGDGSYSFTGVTTGADEFEVVISHEGFGTMQITGTLKYDSEAEGEVLTDLGIVTLPVQSE